LLTGVNRAFPFTNSQSDLYTSHLDTLFKIIFVAPFVQSTQALLLVWQMMHAQGNVNDRFYRALYARLASPSLYSASRQSLFLNLLFKSLRHDTQLNRVSACIKRILQICYYQKSNVACALLLIVSEVFKMHPNLRILCKVPEQIPEELRRKSRGVITFFYGKEKLENTVKENIEKSEEKATENSGPPTDSEDSDSAEEIQLSNLDFGGLGEIDSDNEEEKEEEEKKFEKKKKGKKNRNFG